MVTVVVACVALRGEVLPHAREQWWGLASGLLAAAAGLSFLLATHHGLLTVSAVLISLYPAFTVLLAAVVLRERIHRVQGGGSRPVRRGRRPGRGRLRRGQVRTGST